MNIAAIIIGIDGWEKYTLPLAKSIYKHQPDCQIMVVDNASQVPYPDLPSYCRLKERWCYSAAINYGHSWASVGEEKPDWYIVLSNDVLCTGPFAHLLAPLSNVVAGPQLWHEHGLSWIVGWCVCIPANVWDAVGGWDENFLGSDWEDVDVSTTAREKGFGLVGDPSLPFVHLDQRQRYYIVEDFAGKNAHNQNYFMRKHARVTA